MKGRLNDTGVASGEQVRAALSPSCHVALSGRLSGVLSASSVDRCINVVASRWARLRSEEGRGQVSEGITQHMLQCVGLAGHKPHVSLGGKRWARRDGAGTQGKRWKRPQVCRNHARPARVLWQDQGGRKHFSLTCAAGVMCSVSGCAWVIFVLNIH
jgi:hypothetical protein